MTGRGKIIIGISALVALAVLMFADFNKGPATQLKPKVAGELESVVRNIEKTKEAPLGKIGGVEWDFVCYAGYYANGVESAQKSLKQEGIDFSGFSVSEEAFLDAEAGLTFVSLGQKMMVAVFVQPLPVHFGAAKGARYGACLPAADAYLEFRQGNFRYVDFRKKEG